MIKDIVYNTNKNLDTIDLDEDIVTNSFIIADNAGIAHASIMKTIKKHEAHIESFGVVRFKIVQLDTANDGKRNHKYVDLNEQQATFIITLLRNTEQVLTFKKNLVKSFFNMKQELIKRDLLRDMTKTSNKIMNQMIHESNEVERMNGHAYNTYMNLVYKSLFGMGKKKVCESRDVVYSKGIPAKSFLTTDELKLVYDREQLISTLVSLNKNYNDIKNILNV